MQDKFAKQFVIELHAACKQDDVNAIKGLTTQFSPEGWLDVLAIAAGEGATQVATYCLQQGARVNDQVLDYVICSDRSEPIYRFFVESGHVSVDYDIEWRGTMLGSVAKQGRNPLVEYLLRKGADPNCRVQSMLRKTALACAAGINGDEKTLGLLLDYGATLNRSGALVFAAERGRVANVKFLLAKGADIDELGVEDPGDRRSLNKLGVSLPACYSNKSILTLLQTALHKAVEGGHREVVEILLAAGANDKLKDAKGRRIADIDKTRAESVLPSPRRFSSPRL